MNNQNTIRPDLSRPDTKAKFFAQYYGQKVIMFNNITLSAKHLISDDLEKYWLELTSLSDITDEDVMAVCRINRPDVNWRGYKVVDRKKLALRFAEYNIFSYQYLQSKGYAIKWLNYSIEELIEAGYLVLKKGGENE